jgi:hypothetical protein
MDFTMLRQICQRGRVEAVLADGLTSTHPLYDAFLVLTTPEKLLEHKTSRNTLDAAKPISRGDKLPPVIYDSLLAYIRLTDPAICDYRNIPHSTGDEVLPSVAKAITHITHRKRMFTTKNVHLGNSAVIFRDASGCSRSGFIDEMWTTAVRGVLCTFIAILPHDELSDRDISGKNIVTT